MLLCFYHGAFMMHICKGFNPPTIERDGLHKLDDAKALRDNDPAYHFIDHRAQIGLCACRCFIDLTLRHDLDPYCIGYRPIDRARFSDGDFRQGAFHQWSHG